MATVTLRQIKGSPLTNAEVDANLTNINAETVDNSTAYRLRPSLDVDLVGSKTVSPLLNFSRGSTGTYYDGKTAVKAEENLLSASKNFAPGGQIFAPTVTTNTTDTTAPDGSQTATKMQITTGDPSACRYLNGSLGLAGYTISMYAKAGTVSFLGLSYRNSGGSYAMFNLGTGVVEYSAGCTASVVNAGNGWWRCILANITQSSDYFIISPKDAAGTNAHPYGNNAVTAGATVYFWGPQYENRTTVGPYVETTGSPITNYIPQLLTAPANTPRFDHDPVTGELNGMIVEESRTNLITNSDSFTRGWSTQGISTIAASSCISPSGELSGTKILEDSGSSRHYIQRSVSATFPATLSIFAKAAERTKLFVGDGQAGAVAIFDLTGNGSIFSQNSNYLPITITNVGNGWYRCSITKPAAYVGATMWVGIADSSGQTIYQGDPTKGLYIWGVQIEPGSGMTSYIPTTTTSVTRSADQLSISKTSNWFNSVNGTLALAHDAASGQPLLGDGATTVLSSLGAGTINIDYSNSQLSVVTQSGQTTATQGIFNFDSDLQILGNSTTKANARIKYMKFYPNNVIGSTPEGSGFILDDGYAMLQEDGSVLFQE